MRGTLQRSEGTVSRLFGGFLGKSLGWGRAEPAQAMPERNCTHVILLDGTMSSLCPGYETNIGLTYRLLTGPDRIPGVRVYYEPGIQWRGLARSHEVLAGVGINRQIQRGYAWLSQGYKRGDRVVLMGFSRGGYAVRSLGGLIDAMGLMRPEKMALDRLQAVYQMYREAPRSPAAEAVKAQYCGDPIPISFMGVYDSVRALGIRWPILWRLLPLPHPYHNHTLGPRIAVARHALAFDETRVIYTPILWNTGNAAAGQDVEQMWFRGSHGDIGGHLGGREYARARSNIALNWMLGEAEAAGLDLPAGWHTRFEEDAGAPSVGTFVGLGKLLLTRRRRIVGRDRSENIHPTLRDWAMAKGVALDDVVAAE